MRQRYGRLLGLRFVLVAGSLPTVTACSKGPLPPPLAPIAVLQAPTNPTAAFAAPVKGCVIAGTIVYTGPPVKRKMINTSKASFPVRIGTEDIIVGPNGELLNVVVYIKKGLPKKSHPTPSTPIVLDANSYRFDPHVLAVQVGRTIQLRNADPDNHVWSMASATVGALAFSQPIQGMTKAIIFPAPEMGIKVSDMVLPWMSGYICVFPHPHFNVTNSAGLFRLDGLPPGTYVIEARHEELGTKQQTITVKNGNVARIKFNY